MTDALETPDWAALAPWVNRRLSLLDGRLQSLTPAETLVLAQQLSAAAAEAPDAKAVQSVVSTSP